MWILLVFDMLDDEVELVDDDVLLDEDDFKKLDFLLFKGRVFFICLLG